MIIISLIIALLELLVILYQNFVKPTNYQKDQQKLLLIIE